VITFDQALETPPWKSTASGMNRLLIAQVVRGMRHTHAKQVGNGPW
jgi:hypothetical protein